MPIVIVMFLLLSALPVLLRSQDNSLDLVTEREDAPTRLLRWGVGLLPVDRVEWGQAMVGELDSIEGRARRWRFSLGSAAGIVLMPPWGPIAPMVMLVAFALGGAAVFGVGFVHFGLDSNPWNWLVLAILAAILVGLIVAASVLLRRPGLAGPGLVGGTFVGAVWLGCSGLTFAGILDPIRSVGRLSIPILMIAVPVMVGVSGSVAQQERSGWPAHRSAGRCDSGFGHLLRFDVCCRGNRRRAPRSGRRSRRGRERSVLNRGDDLLDAAAVGDSDNRLGRGDRYDPRTSCATGSAQPRPTSDGQDGGKTRRKNPEPSQSTAPCGSGSGGRPGNRDHLREVTVGIADAQTSPTVVVEILSSSNPPSPIAR